MDSIDRFVKGDPGVGFTAILVILLDVVENMIGEEIELGRSGMWNIFATFLRHYGCELEGLKVSMGLIEGEPTCFVTMPLEYPQELYQLLKRLQDVVFCEFLEDGHPALELIAPTGWRELEPPSFPDLDALEREAGTSAPPSAQPSPLRVDGGGDR